MSDERRRFSRISFHVKAALTAPEGSYLIEDIKNLSVGGCLLPTEVDLTPGTQCRLKIMLIGAGSDIRVEVDAEVVRNSAGELALRFVKIDPDSLVHLQNIIRYNAEDPDEIEKEIQEHPGIR